MSNLNFHGWAEFGAKFRAMQRTSVCLCFVFFFPCFLQIRSLNLRHEKFPLTRFSPFDTLTTSISRLRGGELTDQADKLDKELMLDSHFSDLKNEQTLDSLQGELETVDSRDLIIPDTHATIESAIQHADHGDQVFARAGVHQAPEALFVNRTSIHICGDEQANFLCRWFLMERSWGTFQGVSCAYRLPEDAIIDEACITAFSALWLFEDCELRAVDCPTMRLVGHANCTLLRCNLGGLDSEAGLLATNALSAFDASVVLLHCCAIEDTGCFADRPARDDHGEVAPPHPHARRRSAITPPPPSLACPPPLRVSADIAGGP
jgi:hypothetical protein